MVFGVVGLCSYPSLAIINTLKISGTEHLRCLPRENVLFVSNHQTYFADVIAILHILCAVRVGKTRSLGIPYYLLAPFTRVNYVASEQTMNGTWISRLFAVAGAVTVRRTWNAEAKETRKGLDPSDTRKITRALARNWVITFPQGTTKPFAPGRRGTALIIKHNRPIVIPVIIDGFGKAFNKTGLKLRKPGTILTVQFKKALDIDYGARSEDMLEQIMGAIEQSKAYAMPEDTERTTTHE